MTEHSLPVRSSSSSSSSRMWAAPDWIKDFYARFPLVIHEQEDDLAWRKRKVKGQAPNHSLWIKPPSSVLHPHRRSWASSSPSSLRTQLLLFLCDPPIPFDFREWPNENAAPNGTLPTLHILGENRLLSTEEIRPWLDATYLMKGEHKGLMGMPNQLAYDQALAVAQLVLGHLYPAYLAAFPDPPSNLHDLFPIPSPLIVGLITPLPLFLTGKGRAIDLDVVTLRGVQALEALEVLLGGTRWALGASQPTPLDALICSHLYVIYALPRETALRRNLGERSELGQYVETILQYVDAKR